VEVVAELCEQFSSDSQFMGGSAKGFESQPNWIIMARKIKAL
jgi:hypothetical protein